MGQNSQSYLNDTGNTAYGVNIPVENGFINISNGNLHLEFPLSSPSQRGALAVSERIVYDSRIWMFSPFGTHGSYHWWPYNVYGASNSSGGWRLVKGNEIGAIGYINVSSNTYVCQAADPGDDAKQVTTSVDQITWTDPEGTLHPFNADVTYFTNQCADYSNQSLTPGAATDGSGYQATDDGSGNPIITDGSGTEVFPQIIDRYGNYLSADPNDNLIDDTGRVPVITTQSGNATYYDVLSPNGTIQNNGLRVRYTVTTAPISVSTSFQQSDTYEWIVSNFLTPVQSIQLPDGSQYSFGYDSYGELSSLTLPTGGVIRYEYGNFLDSSNTENRWLESRIVGSNPAMLIKPYVGTTCANYSNGCREYVIVQKPSGDSTMYELTLANGAWNTGQFVYTGTIPIYSGTIPRGAPGIKPLIFTTGSYTYSNACNGPECQGANYVTQSLMTKELFLNGQPSVFAQTQSAFDPTSEKPTWVKMWDYADAASMNTTTAPTSTPVREIDYTYTGLDPLQVKVLDALGYQAGLTTYSYTTNATATSGLPQHGTQNSHGSYLQSVSHWLNTGGSSVTTYTMDDSGMMRGVADANGNPSSSISYQCSNSLPYQSTNPIGQVTQYGYDCASGAIQSVQDANDLANGRSGTTYSYEAVEGRIYTQTNPDGGVTTYTYPSPSEVDTSTTATPDAAISSASIVDSFGRPYETITAGNEIDSNYDINGRPYCKSNPYPQGGTSSGGSCLSSYDGLDRPLTLTRPDGNTMSWTYASNTTNETNEASFMWTRTMDSFGRLTSVVEPGPYGALTTNYSYDGLGNVSQINQLGNSANGGSPLARKDSARIRTFTYDSASRLICASHPESAGNNNCPTNATITLPSGVLSYTYYPAGNIKTITDAGGTVTTYGYDSLNRNILKSYSDGTPASCYSYDSAANGIGRLAREWTQAGNQCASTYTPSVAVTAKLINSYDAMGRPLLSQQCVKAMCQNVPFTQKQTYNLAGNSRSWTDGRGLMTFSQQFDSAGRPLSLTNNLFGSGLPSLLFSAQQYTAAGALQNWNIGETLNFTRTYDSSLRVTSESVTH